MRQKTFMMLKPDAYKKQNQDAIIKDLEKNDLKIEKSIKLKVNMTIMQVLLLHYQEVIDEMDPGFNFVGKLFNSFYYGDHYIMPMIVSYEGNDIIAKTRELVGKTNPQLANKSSLRGKYSDDSYDAASKNIRLVENVIHASDSCTAAERELALWAAYLD